MSRNHLSSRNFQEWFLIGRLQFTPENLFCRKNFKKSTCRCKILFSENKCAVRFFQQTSEYLYFLCRCENYPEWYPEKQTRLCRTECYCPLLRYSIDLLTLCQRQIGPPRERLALLVKQKVQFCLLFLQLAPKKFFLKCDPELIFQVLKVLKYNFTLKICFFALKKHRLLRLLLK